MEQRSGGGENGGLSWIVELIVVGVILAAIVGITSLGSRAMIHRAKQRSSEVRSRSVTHEVGHRRSGGSGLVKARPVR